MQKKQQTRRAPGTRLTKRQAYPIIEQYFKSGSVPIDFYTEVGWSDNQFFSWRKRYMEEHNMLAEEEFGATSFHPIDLQIQENTVDDHPKEEFTIEVIYPNGVILRVYSKHTSQLADLIKLY